MSNSTNMISKFECFKKYYDNGDPSHDWNHIIRVTNTCTEFAEKLNANLRVLFPAAVLHDVVSLPKDAGNRKQASKMAATKAQQLLTNFDYTKDELINIGQIILEHSFSANIKASSLESQILQDADRLDSMGAIGIMRWSTVGTKMKAAYYNNNDPYAEKRELNDRQFSLDHFKTKLFKLYDHLNTDPGKNEGKKRLALMEAFYNQLKCETTS